MLETKKYTGDVEGGLELGVEDVEQAVSEAPEEEQHRHEYYGEDGLPDREGGGAGDSFVRYALAALLVHGVHVRWAMIAHVEDFADLGLFL